MLINFVLFRLQKSVASSDRCPEDTGTQHEPWWLSTLCDDMCELPQAARLLIIGGDASEAWPCCQGRSTFLPSLLVALLCHTPILAQMHGSSTPSYVNCYEITAKPFVFKYFIWSNCYIVYSSFFPAHGSFRLTTTNCYPLCRLWVETWFICLIGKYIENIPPIFQPRALIFVSPTSSN